MSIDMGRVKAWLTTLVLIFSLLFGGVKWILRVDESCRLADERARNANRIIELLEDDIKALELKVAVLEERER